MKKPLMILIASAALLIPNAPLAHGVTLGHGHIDLFHVKTVSGTPVLNVREDVTGSKVERKPADVRLVLPEKAYTDATKRIPGIGSAGWVAPQQQVAGIPWAGWDTSSTGAAVHLKFKSVSGPGSVFLFGETAGGVKPLLNTGIQLRSGSTLAQERPAHVHATWVFTAAGRYRMAVQACLVETGACSGTETYTWDVTKTKQQPAGTTGPDSSRASGTQANDKPNTTATLAPKQENQVEIETNTHVHPSWVFTKPGKYDLKIRQEVTLKSGKVVRDDATLKFEVGGDGNATDGHFDFGAQLKDHLTAGVKDDRKGGEWVKPESLTFGLGAAAETKAPEGIDFIAAAGSQIWMIGATQVKDVPWLGANTQDPELIKKAAGPVRFTLMEATGPGAVAVFTQGNFGNPVDKIWFTSGVVEQLAQPNATGVASPAEDDSLLTGIAIGVCVIGFGALGYSMYRNRR